MLAAWPVWPYIRFFVSNSSTFFLGIMEQSGKVNFRHGLLLSYMSCEDDNDKKKEIDDCQVPKS